MAMKSAKMPIEQEAEIKICERCNYPLETKNGEHGFTVCIKNLQTQHEEALQHINDTQSRASSAETKLKIAETTLGKYADKMNWEPVDESEPFNIVWLGIVHGNQEALDALEAMKAI